MAESRTIIPVVPDPYDGPITQPIIEPYDEPPGSLLIEPIPPAGDGAGVEPAPINQANTALPNANFQYTSTNTFQPSIPSLSSSYNPQYQGIPTLPELAEGETGLPYGAGETVLGSLLSGGAGISGIDPAQLGYITPGAFVNPGTLDTTARSDPAQAFLRGVTDDELVENRLAGLLSGDSRYINNARLRGAELAARRGQFGSSLMAGSAERAAIEAAMPIAVADAQVYREAQQQNFANMNAVEIANLQARVQESTAELQARTQQYVTELSASTSRWLGQLESDTRIDISNLEASTSASIASLNALVSRLNTIDDVNTRITVTNLTNQAATQLADFQARVQVLMQGREQTHQSALAKFEQTGRLQLATIDANLRRELQAAGFIQEMSLAQFDAETRAQLQQAGFAHDLDLATLDANMKMQLQANGFDYDSLLQQQGFQNDINLANLTHEQRMELNELLQGYESQRFYDGLDFSRESQAIAAAMTIYDSYINSLPGFGAITDDAGRARFTQLVTSGLTSGFNLWSALYNVPLPNFTSTGGGGG
jgi:hypothetical protein